MAEKTENSNELPHKIVVVGYPSTITGFRLAGVQETYSAEGKDCEGTVAKLLEREDVGIIIINRRNSLIRSSQIVKFIEYFFVIYKTRL